MPELPEVETMVRGVRAALEGMRIVELSECPCFCKPLTMSPPFSQLREAVIGQRIERVWRRAKRIVIEFDTEHALVIEPRMTGLMLLHDPPDHEHLRLEFRVAASGNITTTQSRRRKPNNEVMHSVWFWDRRGLGTIRYLTRDERELVLGEASLGIDALDMTPQTWAASLQRTQRAIKVALLDQKLVAGIGNLYASEILHLAGIHPETSADRLSRRRIEKLHRATQDILNEAILYEGSTLGDGTYRNALNRDGSYQNKHRVYAKAGERCLTCKQGMIQRIVQAQRSTFFCPKCQTRR